MVVGLASSIDAQVVSRDSKDGRALERARRTLSEAWHKTRPPEGFRFQFDEVPTGLTEEADLIVMSGYVGLWPAMIRVERSPRRAAIVTVTEQDAIRTPIEVEKADAIVREFIYLSEVTFFNAAGSKVRQGDGGWASNSPTYAVHVRSGENPGEGVEVYLDRMRLRRLAEPLEPTEVRLFALRWLLDQLDSSRRELAAVPSAPADRAEWLAILRAAERAPDFLEAHSEPSTLTTLASRLVVNWELAEALPELQRLGFDDEARWLALRTAEDPMERLIEELSIDSPRISSVLDYMRDYPERVSAETRKRALIHALGVVREHERFEQVLDDLLDLGLDADDLSRGRKLCSRAEAESTPHLQLSGLLATLSGESFDFASLEKRTIELLRSVQEGDDRGTELRIAAQWLARSAENSFDRRVRAREIFRSDESLYSQLSQVGDASDAERIYALAGTNCDFALMRSISRLDRDLALRGTTELVERVLSREVRYPIDHAIRALDLLIALDHESGLPLLESMLESRRLGYEDSLEGVRAQLTEADPDRRAARAFANLGWLSEEYHPLLVANLRKRGASEEALAPILDWRRDRGWPLRKRITGTPR